MKKCHEIRSGLILTLTRKSLDKLDVSLLMPGSLGRGCVSYFGDMSDGFVEEAAASASRLLGPVEELTKLLLFEADKSSLTRLELLDIVADFLELDASDVSKSAEVGG